MIMYMQHLNLISFHLHVYFWATSVGIIFLLNDTESSQIKDNPVQRIWYICFLKKKTYMVYMQLYLFYLLIQLSVGNIFFSSNLFFLIMEARKYPTVETNVDGILPNYPIFYGLAKLGKESLSLLQR